MTLRCVVFLFMENKVYKDKRVIHLVAVGANNEIGANNALLWDIPEDLHYFRSVTLGNVCLVGRKTAESFPSILKRRILVGVSDSRYNDVINGIRMMKFKTALDCARVYTKPLHTDCIYVIGGQSIYKATEPYVDELLITEIDKEYQEADTFYNIPDGFEMVDKCAWNTSVNGEKYRFTKWEKLPF